MAALSLKAATSITAQPIPLTACLDSTAQFTVTATGTAPLSYQWRKDGTNLAGATASSLALANVQLGFNRVLAEAKLLAYNIKKLP